MRTMMMRKAAALVGAAAAVTAMPALAGQLTFVNNSKYAFRSLHVAPAKSKDWGENRLSKGALLKQSQRIAIRDLPDGKYKLRMIVRKDLDCGLDDPVAVKGNTTFALSTMQFERCIHE